MSNFRFTVGATVMCNLGADGWKLGRVIALDYRESHWPPEKTAPYQVALEDDHALIYVPEDDDRLCRKPTREDLMMARRIDALAAPPPGLANGEEESCGALGSTQLHCEGEPAEAGYPSYRSGTCHCCNVCPRSWSYAELYSEHYRCAERNGVQVKRHEVDLGTFRVGDSIDQPASRELLSRSGFMQGATLVRLPPGVRFGDDGALAGEVCFDPHRGAEYSVRFVAVSTADWDNPEVGMVRLEIYFQVEGNESPDGFDRENFSREQQEARIYARQSVQAVWDVWDQWEQGTLDNGETREQIGSALSRLRALLEQYPRLDSGLWWAQLGGFYMNVHKLLENTLFECELYLGYALTFGDAKVRQGAERNLEGCYQKRLLEAARFMWMDGLQEMIRGEWSKAAQTLRSAAAKKDGWGWAVNYGDIWFSESAARLVHGAELAESGGDRDHERPEWLDEAVQLLAKGKARVETARSYFPNGHPWASEIESAIESYKALVQDGTDTREWIEHFKLRTHYWCAQVLGGASPFPPKPRPRLENASALIGRLPGHNA